MFAATTLPRAWGDLDRHGHPRAASAKGDPAPLSLALLALLTLTTLTSVASADPGLADDAGYSIAWGCCGHVFHLDCISRWLKTRSVCPLCNREWECVPAPMSHDHRQPLLHSPKFGHLVQCTYLLTAPADYANAAHCPHDQICEDRKDRYVWQS